MQYNYPQGLKPAPVPLRERFYREEFPMEQVEQRAERWPGFAPVIDVGTESTLYKPRLQKMKGKLVRVTDYRDLTHLAEKIADFAPEDVYYNRTIQRDGQVEVNPDQELVFRIAPHELSCRKCDRKRNYMDRKWHKYVFCLDCLTEAAHQTRSLYGFLERHFTDMNLVYAGRAFHIHVNDEEGFKMPMADRTELARRVGSQFPIDEDITAGENELIRLPGTMNGLVSRKATIITVTDLNDPEHILNTTSLPASVAKQ